MKADFFISPVGNDDWTGKLADPKMDKSDGPFATLERAKTAVQSLLISGLKADI